MPPPSEEAQGFAWALTPPLSHPGLKREEWDCLTGPGAESTRRSSAGAESAPSLFQKTCRRATVHSGPSACPTVAGGASAQRPCQRQLSQLRLFQSQLYQLQLYQMQLSQRQPFRRQLSLQCSSR